MLVLVYLMDWTACSPLEGAAGGENRSSGNQAATAPPPLEETMKNFWKVSEVAKASAMSEERAVIAIDKLVDKGLLASAQGGETYTLSQESLENRDLLLTIVKEELERRGLSPLEER